MPADPDDRPLEQGDAESSHALIRRYQAGDRAALDRLLERNYDRIRSIVRARLGLEMLRRTTVEDVLHDVLARILDGMKRFRQQSDAEWIDWVATVAENVIRNQVRKANTKKRKGRTLTLVEQYVEHCSGVVVPDPDTGVGSRVVRREQVAILLHCLTTLTELHREVILLRDFAGMSWRQVAKKMQRATAEACEELHRRAMKDLRRRLATLGRDDAGEATAQPT